MSLIRFDDTTRGPSAALWQGVVDWVRGSLATTLGQRDFEDFAPFLGCAEVSAGADPTANGGTQVTSLAGDPTVTLQTDRFGVINLTEAAAADESVGLAREIFYDIQGSPLTVIEARIDNHADANDPQVFVGFSNKTDPDEVFASGALNEASNAELIGLLWNVDETIDIVAIDDGGTVAVLKDDIGISVERTDGMVKLGLRIEKVTSTTYRLTPCVNGAIARSGAVNVLATLLPEDPMRPVAVTTVDDTTAPNLDVDWIYTADK
jgi:hypothetical protein